MNAEAKTANKHPVALDMKVQWLPPSQLDADPDHDDDGEDVRGFADNLFIRIMGAGEGVPDFQTSRRFSIRVDMATGEVFVYPEAEWGWDAHGDLLPAQRALLQRIEDEQPELLVCPRSLKKAIWELVS